VDALPDPSVPPLSVSVDLPRASVAVTGELDRGSAHHLLDALAVLCTRPSRRWRLDTSGVTFCDAGGLRALNSAHTLAAAHGRSLRLVRTSRPVDRLVQLFGHDRVFPAVVAGPQRSCDGVGTPPTRRLQVAPGAARRIRCGAAATP
jgi:anti-anti-sigma factor